MSLLSSPRIALLAGLAALPLLSSDAGAQALKKETYPELGLEILRPRKYVQIPKKPSEEWIQLRYVEERDERKPKSTLPELMVVRIDWVPDPEPEPEPEPEPKPEDEEDEEDDNRSRSKPAEEAKPKPPPPPPINSLERYVERQVARFELGAEIPIKRPKPQGEYVPMEFELDALKKERRRGWAYAWKSDERTYALLGFAAEDDYKDQVKTWRKVAEKLRISEPKESKETQKWRRYYERRPEYSAPDYRLRIRAEAVGDWEVDDTENYIFVYSTKKEALIRRLKRDLEAIRKAYGELFPPAREVEAVSTVRICRDAAEYRKYGGPPGSGGYWYYVDEELVFFEYADKDGERGSGKEDSLIVLYHEAFHQYIYYCVGEVAPHSWFNEGYGDYFSGAQFNSYGEVAKISVNPWRIHTIQRAIDDYTFIPWDEIIRFEQRDYYKPGIRHICYAQGWSMIYFLNQSPVVRKHERWSRILDDYFEELKAAHAQEMAQLERSGLKDDPAQKAEAAIRTRTRAVEHAFEGVDIKALQEAWLDFTRGLKPPK